MVCFILRNEKYGHPPLRENVRILLRICTLDYQRTIIFETLEPLRQMNTPSVGLDTFTPLRL